MRSSSRSDPGNAITFTGNADHGYIGQKHNGTDTTDMVIQWSNDSGLGQFAPDHLTFRFATRNDVTRQTGAFSLEGLEAMRMYPLNDSSAHVGVGDFWRATFNNGGSIVEPSERLDVLDGRLRIRQLPDDPAAVDSFLVMVVDRQASPSGERGVVKWVEPTAIGGSDCDWVIQDPDPHVSTGYTGSSCEWNDKHGVGIGLPVPKFKLQVFHHDNTLLEETAIWGSSRFALENYEWMPAIHGEARSPGADDVSNMQSIGVQGDATGAAFSFGVFGNAAQSPTANGNAYGVLGVTGFASAFENADWCVGVYGKASGATSGNDWGGWFEGEGFLGASTWTYSDANLKTEIEALESAESLEAVMQLQPRTYLYDTDQFQGLGLPSTEQIGLVAQEVETVLPQLVKDVTRPALLDSLGQIAQEALEFKAMNYMGLIPVLVSAIQAQNARIDGLQQQLAACCATPNSDGTRSTPVTGAEREKLTPAQERLLRIAPNPFTDRTTLYCTLERAGRMQLMANSADGRDLMVLSEGQHAAGEFQYVWSTENLAPGVYYITLLLDGEPVVKRAVKVGR